MKSRINIILLFFIVNIGFANNASDVILQSKAATALNKVTLYPDSTFFVNATASFEAGEFFEVIGESYFEHEDDDQNQKFKWFKVRTMNDKTGWVFGGEVAVIVPDNDIDSAHKKFHKRKVNLDNGFDNAMMWIASIQGRDNFHKQDYMNPIYNEFYLVMTNDLGRSVTVNIAGVNARGKNETQEINFHDLTGDDYPEIIVQQSSFPNSSDLENKNINIYSMQAGSLRKIFEERVTLNYEDDVQSPTIAKYLEINNDVIRVEYIDYVKCTNYKQDLPHDERSQKTEHCMEYVTYSYIWDDKLNNFEILFEETRTTPTVIAKNGGMSIKDQPSLSGSTVKFANSSEHLKVIKHFEKAVLMAGQKRFDNFLYVQHPSGQRGYVNAKNVKFVNTYHNDVLSAYYENTPASKNDFKTNIPFIKVVGLKGDAAFTK